MTLVLCQRSSHLRAEMRWLMWVLLPCQCWRIHIFQAVPFPHLRFLLPSAIDCPSNVHAAWIDKIFKHTALRSFSLHKAALLYSPSIGNTLWRVSTMFTRSAITPPEVNGFGWNFGNSENIAWSWPWQILGAIRAEARAGDLAEVLFFLSGKQRTTLPISSQTIFTKFALKTWRGESFRKHFFWKFALKGSFFKKTVIIVNDFRLQAEISRKWLQILENDDRLAPYGMFAFHPYSSNQLKVIRLANRLRTKKDFPGHWQLFRLVLQT